MHAASPRRLLAFFAALALARSGLAPAFAATPPPAWCETPTDCAEEGATCVAWLCRTGAERTRVEVGHRVAVVPAIVATSRKVVSDTAALFVAALQRDLGRSGFYEVIPDHRFPPGWNRDGASVAEVRRQRWRAAGVTRLVMVSVHDDGTVPRWRIRALDLERWGGPGDKDDRGILPIERQGEIARASAAWVNGLVGHDTGLPGALGGRLVGTSEVSPGVKEIVTIRDDGTGWTQISQNGSLNLHAAWGPGGQIGWMSYVSGNTDWLVDGRPLSTRPGLNSAGSWSPDGRFLALAVGDRGDSQLVLLDGATGEEHARLTDTSSLATSPTWSPDGGTLAFVSDSQGGQPQIFSLHLATGRLEQLTREGYNTNPEWSPAGGVIAFQRQYGSSFAVMRLDLATGDVRRLTQGKGSAENPTFSPDGRFIAYTVTEGRSSRLWVMTADGSRPAPFGGETAGRSFLSPSWGALLP